MIELDISALRRAGGLTPGARYEWRDLKSSDVAGSSAQWWRSVFLEALDGGKDSGTQVVCNGSSLTFTYPLGLKPERIELLETPLNFGNSRPWFACPGTNCGRRCGRLYWTGENLRCRRCAGVSYESQKEEPHDRGLRAAAKCHARCSTLATWISNNDVGTMPPRPKGMHYATYRRLCEQHRERYQGWNAKMQADFRALEARVERLRSEMP